MDSPEIFLRDMTEDQLLNVFLAVISRPGPLTTEQMLDIQNIQNEFLMRELRFDN